MPTKTAVNGSAATARVACLEQKLDELAWLHAELAVRHKALAAVVSAMLAQQMQPVLTQQILTQLSG